MEMGGETKRKKKTDMSVSFFPVAMGRKESCLLLSLTLGLYCVVCVRVFVCVVVRRNQCHQLPSPPALHQGLRAVAHSGGQRG